jgi:hypothetical protein
VACNRRKNSSANRNCSDNHDVFELLTYIVGGCLVYNSRICTICEVDPDIVGSVNVVFVVFREVIELSFIERHHVHKSHIGFYLCGPYKCTRLSRLNGSPAHGLIVLDLCVTDMEYNKLRVRLVCRIYY